MRIERYFDEVAKGAIKDALGVDAPAILKPTQDAKHGDYQVNGAMALAKQRKENPRDLATKIAAELVKHPAVSAAEVAGPGFVNLKLDEAWIGSELAKNLDDPRDGVTPVESAERIVVDYSSPNIAKQMHVGHLRSTILGHALVSMLRFVGHTVIGDNHVGDWGTQFGLLIAGLRKFRGGDATGLDIEGLEGVYRQASALSKDDESFANEARAELAKLQAGDAQSHALWQQFVDITRGELDKIYARMGVTFEEWLGESFYDPMLPRVIETVTAANIAREDQGALCIFFNEWAESGAPAPGRLAKQKEPFIVRKKDGAFLYSTTDIATVMHRHEVLHTTRAIYVVDARQALHFEQLFAVASRLGFTMRLEHVGFGTVLGPDGKPIKTRDGKAITLASLLDEAEARALEVMKTEKVVDLPEDELARVARAVGIGAVKYSDLRQNRLSDYQFDMDKLIEFRGNSGPYLQFAAARIGAIFRKGELDEAGFRVPSVALDAPEEKALARTLLRFADVVHAAAESCQPHLLTDHLYALSRDFSSFIEACQVLKSEGATRESRLALCALTGRQLRRGLVLLGIEPVERM